HLPTDSAVEGQLELADEAVGDRAGTRAGLSPGSPADGGGGRRRAGRGGRGRAPPADAGEVRRRAGRRGRGHGAHRLADAWRGHAVGSAAISRRGAGTSEMTRWTMVSAVIPSARAA